MSFPATPPAGWDRSDETARVSLVHACARRRARLHAKGWWSRQYFCGTIIFFGTGLRRYPSLRFRLGKTTSSCSTSS